MAKEKVEEKAKDKAKQNVEKKVEKESKSREKAPKKQKIEKPAKPSDKKNVVDKKETKDKKRKVECDDSFCPFHGKTKLHGRSLIGEVVSTKSHKTATIVIERQHYLKKYERYEKRRTKIQVHNPSCVSAKVGSIVRVTESRPLSKTKHFVVVEVLKKK